MVVFLRETAFGRVVVQAAELLRAVDSDGEDSDSDGVRFLLILSLFYACFTTDLGLLHATGGGGREPTRLFGRAVVTTLQIALDKSP